MKRILQSMQATGNAAEIIQTRNTYLLAGTPRLYFQTLFQHEVCQITCMSTLNEDSFCSPHVITMAIRSTFFNFFGQRT